MPDPPKALPKKNTKPQPLEVLKPRSWFKVVFGSSLIKLIFGRFFENKNNTASILAIILVVTLCFVIVVKEKYDNMTGLLNVVFVIIGYYFGAKQTKETDEDDSN